MPFRDDEAGAHEVEAQDELARLVDKSDRMLDDVEREQDAWRAEDERSDRTFARFDRVARVLGAVVLIVLVGLGLAAKC